METTVGRVVWYFSLMKPEESPTGPWLLSFCVGARRFSSQVHVKMVAAGARLPGSLCKVEDWGMLGHGLE